jgi:hypothetical protein
VPIHIELQTSTPDQSSGKSEALVAPVSKFSIINYDNISSLKQRSQLSLRPGFAYEDLQKIDSKQRTPVYFDSGQVTSATHPYPAESTFAPKGELAHEYWRAMSGQSRIVERYELYLHDHPAGALADIASERIMDLSRRPD